jgi:hypothetical protein
MSTSGKSERLRPVAVRAVAALLLLLVFLSWVWAVALLPFVNVLPYLQASSLSERVLTTGIFFAFAVATASWAQTKKQRSSFAAVHLSGWKGKLGMLAAFVFLTYLTAELSANIWGTVVKLCPGQMYTERHEITAAKNVGAKYRSIELQLKGPDQKIRSLTLSRKLFEYQTFEVGETVLLSGKSTFFGVYVSEVRSAVMPNPSVKGTATSGLRPLASAPYVER